jgi:ribonuclease-3
MTAQPLSLAKLSSRLAELKIRELALFRAPEVVEQALTHSSHAAERGSLHNERLEMLGDAVLGFLVAELLFDLFPDAPEGVLTRLRASLVDEESLAGQARLLGLGDLLALGRGEEQTGGRDRSSTLADSFEAIVAALYRSEGLPMVTALVSQLFREAALQRRSDSPQPTDFKTMLQERSQGECRLQPCYRIARTSGPDHDRSFVAEVLLSTLVAGQGEGRSKKLAEQQAARAALESWDRVVTALGSSATAGVDGLVRS